MRYQSRGRFNNRSGSRAWYDDPLLVRGVTKRMGRRMLFIVGSEQWYSPTESRSKIPGRKKNET